MMKLYAPTYYKRFRCIADRCEHSCCIGWEIDVDSKALERYSTLKHPYGSIIRESIAADETPHFKLGAQERCPHLDERGLCRIILNVGEDYLCDICREHPRFYNYTDVAEVGLGLSCAEAARLILSSDDYATLECIGDVNTEPDGIGFDGRAERGKIYMILQDRTREYAANLEEIYRLYAIKPREDCEFSEILDSLEYLNEEHRALFLQYSSRRRPTGQDACLERFLAYLIYRHCTEAFDEADFRDRLAFCLFCERLLASLICVEGADSSDAAATLASIISEEIEYSDENTEALTYFID